MKCLVTGASGFTGLHLAMALRKQGHEVRALVRSTAMMASLDAAGIEVVHGELVDPQSVAAAARGCEQIYHLAAVYRTAGHSHKHYYEVNVGGTENVLAAARKHGCERVIHCSTCGVHGHVKRPPANEQSPLAPSDVYQRSKLAGELKVQEAIDRGQRATIFRPCAIYGEGDLRFLKLFRGVARSRFVMIGPGTVRLHMVHVDDLVAGILLCGTRPEALGEVFLLGGPQAPTLNELVLEIANALAVPAPHLRVPFWPIYAAAYACEKIWVPFGADPPIHRRRVGFFTHHREFDCSKAIQRLGYQPQVTAGEGIRRTAEWYRAHQLSERSLRPAVMPCVFGFGAGDISTSYAIGES